MSIAFETTLFAINSWTILRLPEDASAKLPSTAADGVKYPLHSALSTVNNALKTVSILLEKKR